MKTELDKIQQKSEAKIRTDIMSNRIPHPFNNKYLKDMSLQDKIDIGKHTIKNFINSIDDNNYNEFIDIICEIKYYFKFSDEQIDNILNEIYPKYKNQIDHLINIITNKLKNEK